MNLQRALVVLAGLVVVRVTFAIVSNYGDYFPPNFHSEFLYQRQSYFFGPYRWAFYTHILAGPIALLLGLLLISKYVRQRFPKVHRAGGRIQIGIILLLLAPSGLYLAWYAESGIPAGLAFAALAVATVACAVLGWKAAVQRRFNDHEQWMLRCYTLLCSAIVLRIIGGLQLVTNISGDWTYPLTAWASWLVPLAVLEALLTFRRRRGVSHEVDQLPADVLRHVEVDR
jgi:hypothetical protein